MGIVLRVNSVRGLGLTKSSRICLRQKIATLDFLVIGGGIIGMNIARQLKRQISYTTVTVIEKGNHSGNQANGRNSLVYHVGFYFSPESLNAQFTRLGKNC
ncbi:MAG: hypothetical protein NPIRA03_33540 [Nitrospirales bacterium]|nr:MAG: hypothetical protein NPIRA03_33540 [Nitrospirales bacterium]